MFFALLILGPRNIHTGEQETVSWLGFEDYDASASGISDQSPSKVVFSGPLPDYDALLAVGYRNHPVLIWDAMEVQLLGKCETVSTNGVDDMAFNPNSEIPALVVSYADGNLSVFDYTTLKLDSSRPNVHASSLSCSKDGRALVCGTSQGTIHVYEFDQGYSGNIVLTPIYRINALDDAIRGVAFHFQGLRFVDITRRQCRVWEPAALVRRDNEVESTSDVVSLPHRTVGAVSAPDQPKISASLAASKDGRFIVGGNTSGQVILFSTDDGSELGTAYCHARGASITSVVLADSGTLVASTDDSGRIIVAELPQSTQKTAGDGSSDTLASKIILDHRLGAVMSQLLFGPEANRLLTVSSDAMELWELPQGTRLKRHTLGAGDTLTSPSVLQHPSIPTSFMAMTADICRIFNWNDGEEVTPPDAIRLQYPTSRHASSSGSRICHLLPGVGVLEHSNVSQSSSAQWMFLPTTAFDANSENCGQPLKDDELDAISPTIHSVLGVIRGTRIVFLDTALWICSFDLRLSPATRVQSRSRSPRPLGVRSPAPEQMTGNIRRHFFAMGEWRDGGNRFNALMVPSQARSARNGGHNFAFVAGHRVVLVQGGLDFSETVALGSPGRVSRFGNVNSSEEKVRPLGKAPSAQQWTVVSGSMHRRSSNW